MLIHHKCPCLSRGAHNSRLSLQFSQAPHIYTIAIVDFYYPLSERGMQSHASCPSENPLQLLIAQTSHVLRQLLLCNP